MVGRGVDITEEKSRLVYSIFWNCSLITIGSLIQAIALKAVAIPHNFVPGDCSGSTFLRHKIY
jgi:hypothetical protein